MTNNANSRESWPTRFIAVFGVVALFLGFRQDFRSSQTYSTIWGLLIFFAICVVWLVVPFIFVKVLIRRNHPLRQFLGRPSALKRELKQRFRQKIGVKYGNWLGGWLGEWLGQPTPRSLKQWCRLPALIYASTCFSVLTIATIIAVVEKFDTSLQDEINKLRRDNGKLLITNAILNEGFFAGSNTGDVESRFSPDACYLAYSNNPESNDYKFPRNEILKRYAGESKTPQMLVNGNGFIYKHVIDSNENGAIIDIEGDVAYVISQTHYRHAMEVGGKFMPGGKVVWVFIREGVDFDWKIYEVHGGMGQKQADRELQLLREMMEKKQKNGEKYPFRGARRPEHNQLLTVIELTSKTNKKVSSPPVTTRAEPPAALQIRQVVQQFWKNVGEGDRLGVKNTLAWPFIIQRVSKEFAGESSVYKEANDFNYVKNLSWLNERNDSEINRYAVTMSNFRIDVPTPEVAYATYKCRFSGQRFTSHKGSSVSLWMMTVLRKQSARKWKVAYTTIPQYLFEASTAAQQDAAHRLPSVPLVPRSTSGGG